MKSQTRSASHLSPSFALKRVHLLEVLGIIRDGLVVTCMCRRCEESAVIGNLSHSVRGGIYTLSLDCIDPAESTCKYELEKKADY